MRGYMSLEVRLDLSNIFLTKRRDGYITSSLHVFTSVYICYVNCTLGYAMLSVLCSCHMVFFNKILICCVLIHSVIKHVYTEYRPVPV